MRTVQVIFLRAVVLTVCTLISRVDCVEWCYHLQTCNDTTWASIVPTFCNDSIQSPINIHIGTFTATLDVKLKNFPFTNFNINTGYGQVRNGTGQNIKVILEKDVKISGGGLLSTYDSLQFHLHWGNGSSVPWSDHTVNGKCFPVELHILNLKDVYNGNTTKAEGDPTGLAALGFLIEYANAMTHFSPPLSLFLSSGQTFTIPSGISLDDLLVGVNRSIYYRYLGSLTTPACNEAVVWTVFKEPIKVSKDLIDLFSTTVHINDTSSPFMRNVYRNIQPDLTVTKSSASTTCYSLGLMVLSLALWKK
ncbi:carbonic anhydrase 12-like [Paralichthys olivaceus]|uniref:carbonic anhydrase 12-like n=1 Tax=Paralichthys olivaceus TaxID=8255 RepID=UPI00375093BD